MPSSPALHRVRPHERFELHDGPPDVPAGPADPRWTRPALALLLLGTAVLYLWDLSASGYANSFYAAAAQSASAGWKAWFFGSLDLSGFITVDKPPASLWVMGLSGRIFGFNSWSLLAPQAVEGVLAVWLLFAAVRRWSGARAGLLAGATLALTPAAALMFRFDNPDALLVLLLTAGAYCMVRALEDGATRWLVFAGSAVGLAFLTKMLRGFLVLPAFALVYLIAAPVAFRRRLWQSVVALVSVVVSAGWWIAIVQFWPASSRPYIGGSTDNTVLDLVLGYNGFGRLLGGSGNGGGGAGGGAAGSSFGGATGITRLFGSEMGNEISWLLPAALLALLFGLAVRWRAPRTDRIRAALILWGGWLLVTGLVFSYMEGTIHPYYTVALAPAVAGLVAVGGKALWEARSGWIGRLGLTAMIVSSGLWSYELLSRNESWLPWLRYTILVAALSAAAAVLMSTGGARGGRARRVLAAVLLVGVLAGGTGSAAYAVATAATPHSGSIPSAGPVSASTSGTNGGGMGGGMGNGGMPGGAPSSSGTSSGSSSSGSVADLLAASDRTWAAATVGDQSAAQLQLSSGKAVMAIGGWSGSDPTPTLAQFQRYVAEGKVSYFVAGGQMGGGGGSSDGTAARITAWVEATYTATTVGGQTVYDLTS